MRFLTSVLLLGAVAALTIPFLAASLLLDRKGVPVRAQVVAKDEWITVQYSSWTRHSEAELKYKPPDDYGPATLFARLNEEQYDGMQQGATVELHYLLAK